MSTSLFENVANTDTWIEQLAAEAALKKCMKKINGNLETRFGAMQYVMMKHFETLQKELIDLKQMIQSLNFIEPKYHESVEWHSKIVNFDLLNVRYQKIDTQSESDGSYSDNNINVNNLNNGTNSSNNHPARSSIDISRNQNRSIVKRRHNDNKPETSPSINTKCTRPISYKISNHSIAATSPHLSVNLVENRNDLSKKLSQNNSKKTANEKTTETEKQNRRENGKESINSKQRKNDKERGKGTEKERENGEGNCDSQQRQGEKKRNGEKTHKQKEKNKKSHKKHKRHSVEITLSTGNNGNETRNNNNKSKKNNKHKKSKQKTVCQRRDKDICHDGSGSLTLVDDIWTNIFLFLSVKDYVCVHLTCNHFSDLTSIKSNNIIVNRYWQRESRKLCENIDRNWKPNVDGKVNWFKFYVELIDFLEIHPRKQFWTKKQLIDELDCNSISDSDDGTTTNNNINGNTICPEFPVGLEQLCDTNPLYTACVHDHALIFDMLLCNMMNKDDGGYSYAGCDINSIPRRLIDKSYMCTIESDISGVDGDETDAMEEEDDEDDSDSDSRRREREKEKEKERNRRCGGSIVFSPLFAAIASGLGSLKIVRYLLHEKENMNRNESYNYQIDVNVNHSGSNRMYFDTPLVYACYYGYTDIVELLLNHETMTKNGINAQDSWGKTSLYCACEEGHYDIVSLLMEDGRTNASLSDNDGVTPLMAAMDAGHDSIAHLLRSFDVVK